MTLETQIDALASDVGSEVHALALLIAQSLSEPTYTETSDQSTPAPVKVESPTDVEVLAQINDLPVAPPPGSFHKYVTPEGNNIVFTVLFDDSNNLILKKITGDVRTYDVTVLPNADHFQLTPKADVIVIDEMAYKVISDGTDGHSWESKGSIYGNIATIEVPSEVELAVTKAAKYEYRDLWAEENGPIASGQAEWSYGNGATGYIGVPFDAGWEVVQMAVSADVHAVGASADIYLMNYNTPSNSSTNEIANILIASETDGGGTEANSRKIQDYGTPIAVPQGNIGFYTKTVTGSVSDVRVYARFRRQIGEQVTDVSLV